MYLYNLRITSIFEFSSPREPRVVKEEMEGGLAFEAKGKRGRGIRSLAESTHDRVETRACIGLRPRKDQDFTGESTFPTKGSEREQVSRSRNRGNLLFLLRFIYIYMYISIDSMEQPVGRANIFVQICYLRWRSRVPVPCARAHA